MMKFFKKLTAAVSAMAIAASMAAIPALAITDEEALANRLVSGTDFTVVNGAGAATNKWFSGDVESGDVNDRSKYILDFGAFKTVTLSKINVYGMGDGAFKFYGSDTYDETYGVCTDDNLIAQVNLSSGAWVETAIENADAYRYIYMTLANDNWRDKAKEIVLVGTVNNLEYPTNAPANALWKDTNFNVVYGNTTATNKWFNKTLDTTSNDRGDYILDFGEYKAVTLSEILISGLGNGSFKFYGSNTYDETYEVCTDESLIAQTYLTNGAWSSTRIANTASYRYIYMRLVNNDSRDKANEIVLCGTVSDNYSYPENSLVKGTAFEVRGTTTDLSGWFNQTVESGDVNNRANCILDFGENKAVTLSQIDVYGAGTGAFTFYGSNAYDESYAECTDANLLATTNLINGGWKSYTINSTNAYRYIYMKLVNNDWKDKAKEIVLCGTVADVTPSPEPTTTPAATAEKDENFKPEGDNVEYPDAEVWKTSFTPADSSTAITTAKWTITATNSSNQTGTATTNATLPTKASGESTYNFGIVLYNIPEGVTIKGVTVTVE